MLHRELRSVNVHGTSAKSSITPRTDDAKRPHHCARACTSLGPLLKNTYWFVGSCLARSWGCGVVWGGVSLLWVGDHLTLNQVLWLGVTWEDRKHGPVTNTGSQKNVQNVLVRKKNWLSSWYALKVQLATPVFLNRGSAETGRNSALVS